LCAALCLGLSASVKVLIEEGDFPACLALNNLELIRIEQAGEFSRAGGGGVDLGRRGKPS
jgi:hypothetical protein